MILTIFAVGTLWFWLLSLAFVATLIACVETESPVAGFFWFIFYLLALYAGGSVPVFQWIAANPKLLILLLVGYLAAGTVWATTKWALYCQKIASAFKELRDQWLREHATEKDDDYKTERLKKYIEGCYFKHVRGTSLPLSVSSNKERIMTWMIWWPASAIWSLLDDFVVRAFENIYNAIRGGLQKISDRIFAGVASV